jgi:LacI family transcriptional regulator
MGQEHLSVSRSSRKDIGGAPSRRSAPRSDALRWVYLSLPFDYGYTRDVVVGASSYSPTRMRWRLVIAESALVPENLPPDCGIIGTLGRHNTDAILAAGIAAVNVSDAWADCRIPKVVPDNREAGRMAARHLIDLGYRTVAAVPTTAHHYDTERCAGFREQARATPGVTLLPDVAGAGNMLKGIVLHRTRDGGLGLFVTVDRLARRLVDECFAQGVMVPGHVSVVGCDNDTIQCETMRPSLSSVDINGRQVGFEAARLLETLMAGDAPPTRPILVPPARVVPRESTAKRSTDDPLLLRAVEYIRNHATEGLTVEQLAQAMCVTPKTLRKRYGAHFREPVKAEIRRMQVRRACDLLIQTDMKSEDIASACGQSHLGRFSQTFRDQTGDTMRAYRRRNRVR